MKEHLSKRQRDNPGYSLRAYARDLGIPASTLSLVLLGKRPLPPKSTQRVMEKIRLNAKERTLFIQSLTRRKPVLDQIQIKNQNERFVLDETYYQIVAEWEHYAALMLFDCGDFGRTPEAIQNRLGINAVRAEVVIANLLKAGMLVQNDEGNLERVHAKIRTTEDVSSAALRAAHRENLEIAAKKLEEVAVELRDFSSIALAVDSKKIPEVKTVIREFRQKLAELLKDGKKKDVFQLAIQFYPLTQTGEKK